MTNNMRELYEYYKKERRLLLFIRHYFTIRNFLDSEYSINQIDTLMRLLHYNKDIPQNDKVKYIERALKQHQLMKLRHTDKADEYQCLIYCFTELNMRYGKNHKLSHTQTKKKLRSNKGTKLYDTLIRRKFNQQCILEHKHVWEAFTFQELIIINKL